MLILLLSVVYIKNTSEKDSGVISDFYALDYAFPTGKADLYYSIIDAMSYWMAEAKDIINEIIDLSKYQENGARKIKKIITFAN